MANDLNQCTFIGRLGKDVEKRAFPSGDEVANFSIAVGESWKDKATGEKKEKTEWVNIVCTGGLAKIAGDYLRKGSQVMISGKLRTRKWTDQASGQERYATEIRADSMQMLGGKTESSGGYGDSDQQPRQSPSANNSYSAARMAQAPARSGFDDMDDDIAF